ncbi:MAG: alkaline phosphatase family protein, partial [Saprospiraceae bacterium]
YLKTNKLKYRLYQDRYTELSFPIVQALEGIHWSEMNDISTFADDLADDYDYALTLIEPNYGDIFLDTYRGGSSQHPMDGMQQGEALIKTVYEAILNSPIWENSLLIITYDEHGGFYDHVGPQKAPPPADGGTKYSKHGFDFTRYGVRVPAVVVSPYIPAGKVSNVLYDHTSMIKTVTETWALTGLTDRDKKANGLSALLTLNTPRQKSDCPTVLNVAVVPEVVPAALTSIDLAQLDTIPLPDSGNIIGFLQIAMKTDYEMSMQTEAEENNIMDTFQNIQTLGDARNYMNTVLEKMK